MLALRSLLVIAGADREEATRAQASAADVVVLDLAAPALAADRANARALVGAAVDAIGGSGRAVIVRVSPASSGELAADIEAAVRPALAAVVLAGTEVPQDARDADVLLRKFELRHELTPGAVRLISEIDSAAGLQALPIILEAVDRHEAVALNTARLHRDLGVPPGQRDTHDVTMTMVAVAARAAELPWLLAPFGGDRGFTETTRAHELGAAGATIDSEASARGVNSLFLSAPSEVAAARAVLGEWERLRSSGAESGVVVVSEDGASRLEPVDRRSMRAARLIVGRAEAIEARERLRD